MVCFVEVALMVLAYIEGNFSQKPIYVCKIPLGKMENALNTSSERDPAEHTSSLAQRECIHIIRWLNQNKYSEVAIYTPRLDTFSYLLMNKLGSQNDGCLEWKMEEFANIERLDSVDAIVVLNLAEGSLVTRSFGQKSTLKIVILKSVSHILKCYQEMYHLVERLHGLEKRGVQTLILRMPMAANVVNPSRWEQTIKKNKINWQFILKHTDKYLRFAGKKEQNAVRLHVNGCFHDKVHVNFKDYVVRDNVRSKYVNVINHIRLATNTPTAALHDIHLIGDSTVSGNYDMDKDTIASHIQGILNKNQGVKYASLIYGANGVSPDMMQRRLRDINVESDDIVVIVGERLRFTSPEFLRSCEENGVPVHDCQPDFDRPHNFGEVFVDNNHVYGDGNRKIAEILYVKLFGNPVKLTSHEVFQHFYCSSMSCKSVFVNTQSQEQIAAKDELMATSQILSFSDRLLTYRNNLEMVGAVVMNCNPFTLGHLHLVEIATAQMDCLFIFVVEEERSEFLFTIRMEFVKNGTAYLANVVVLTSGQFIISAVTLPEYFIKERNQNAILDASTDLWIFCGWIAPALGVHTRFVGEEPFDRVTRQYNYAMANTLPKYGLKLQIIQRKESCGSAISASRVRVLLENQDFEEMVSIVPQTTVEYLRKKSNNRNEYFFD